MTFWFREKDLRQMERFYSSRHSKAMAVYGRRRTGKTTLALEFIRDRGHCVYFQVTDPNMEYRIALSDFKKKSGLSLAMIRLLIPSRRLKICLFT